MEIYGTTIKLAITITSDIKSIIQFEKANSNFVGQNTQEEHLNLLKNANCLHLSIKHIKKENLIGHVILFDIKNPNQIIEFRRIVINQKGSGYGNEAIELIKQLCFNELNVNKIWLDVYSDNLHAIKLYESKGFISQKITQDKRPQKIYTLSK